MNRTGWTVLAVAGVLVLVVVVFEVVTRKDARTVPAPDAGGPPSSAALLPELPAPGTKPDLPGTGALDDQAGGAAGEVTDASHGQNPSGAETDASATGPEGDPGPDATGRPGEDASSPGAGPGLEQPEGLRTMEVTLYFVRPDGQGLSPEPVAIFATAAVLDRLKQTVAALIRGPGPGSRLEPSLPAGTPLRDLFLDGQGTLYIDFGQEMISHFATGSATEIHAAASLANTLILNFVEVRRVRLLAMGDDIETLGGHLDLSRSLRANRGLIRPWQAPPDEWWSEQLVSRMTEAGETDILSVIVEEDETDRDKIED